MTLMTTVGDDGTADRMVALAEAQFFRLAEDLSVLIERIRQGDATRAKDTVTAMKDLERALQCAFEERNRVGKLRRQEASGVQEHALDFAAARDEIGRRLALLRDAGRG